MKNKPNKDKQWPLEIGDDVLLTGTHPWKGNIGKVVALEKTGFGKRPRVELQDGTNCFVMSEDDAVIVNAADILNR